VTDWRLDLAIHTKGATLTRKMYARRSEEWDHDHCEACTQKFSETIPLNSKQLTTGLGVAQRFSAAIQYRAVTGPQPLRSLSDAKTDPR
jgi:hypothetical protein